MTDIYRQAFEILEQTETETDYHMIVNMIIKYGYEKTLLSFISE